MVKSTMQNESFVAFAILLIGDCAVDGQGSHHSRMLGCVKPLRQIVTVMNACVEIDDARR